MKRRKPADRCTQHDRPLIDGRCEWDIEMEKHVDQRQIYIHGVTMDDVTRTMWEVDSSLDPTDPFERVIIDMVATNRRKRADYAVDGSPWSNFDDTANALGIDGFAPVDAANFNIEQKSARLRSLRKNGRMNDPANESVADTYLDRAVYSVIALAMHKYPSGKVE